MSIADIILLILLILGTYQGFKKGFLMELITILSFVLAIIGGFKLLHIGMEYLSKMYDGFGTFLPFVAFIVIFVLIIFLVNATGAILKRIIDWTPFGIMDNVLGAIVGLLKWSLVIGVFFWVVDALSISIIQQAHDGSVVLPWITQLLTYTGGLISTVFPAFEDFMTALQDLFQSFVP